MEKWPVSEILLAVFILWSFVKELLSDKNKDLKNNTLAINENSMSIRELRIEIMRLAHVPKDLNEAHTKIRLLEERIKNLDN